jgi:Flp pilus assembly protein TadD
MHMRDFQRAEAALRQRLALEEVADGRLNLGLCRLELGHAEEARTELERAHELAPENARIERELARLRTLLGR